MPNSEASAAEIEGAMRIMLARRHAELAAGARSVGWKVAFNAAPMQLHFGLDGLVVGYLTDTTVLEPGQPVSLGGWTQPMVEVELALRIGPDGDIASIAPALELVDIDLPFDLLAPILEGNIFHRGVLFGPETAAPDLDNFAVTVTQNHAVTARGSLSDDPTFSVASVRSYLERHGAQLTEGDRIIAGTLITPVSPSPGDHIEVSFGALGSLRLDFS